MNRLLTGLAIPILALGLTAGGLSTAWGKEMKSNAAEFRASKIIGAEVKDQQGKEVGKIKDLLVDSQDSRVIMFAVLDPSRSLEFGHDRLIAIPFTALSRSGRGRVYTLSVTRDQLAKAPSFNEDHWPNLSDRSWSAEVYQYYGQSPYWTEGQYGQSPYWNEGGR